MQKEIKLILSKINFAVNRNPRIERRKNWRDFVPEPYESVLTITADFELSWSWRYAKQLKNPLQEAVLHGNMERENIPEILNLSERFGIPITWATVGHLFLESCEKKNGIAHSEIVRPPFHENEYWKYFSGDWFDYDPCSNYREEPSWYCPDLIKLILNSKIKQEIACHTFSHIDCSDNNCPPILFESELAACISEATKLGISLKSFVHPGHTIGNLVSLKKLGFTSFQTDYQNTLGYPVEHLNGLWEIKRTMEFVLRGGFSINYHIYRYKKIVERAILNNSLCHFWFHPSQSKRLFKEVIPALFEFLQNNDNRIWITTVSEYVDWLNGKKCSKF